MLWLSCIIRKEHKAHSPACDFMLLKKTVDSLTVEEFLKLQKERQKFIIVSMSSLTSHVVALYNTSSFKAALCKQEHKSESSKIHQL